MYVYHVIDFLPECYFYEAASADRQLTKKYEGNNSFITNLLF